MVRVLASIIDSVGRLIFSRTKTPLNARTARRILVLKPDHLGDCFLATPLFEYLYNTFGIRADIACQESSSALFRGNPFIGVIYTINYGKFVRNGTRDSLARLLARIKVLRQQHYDIVIDARGSFLGGLISFLVGAPARIGFCGEEAGSFFFTHTALVRSDKHESGRYEDILSIMGVCVSEWRPAMYPSDSDRKAVEEFLRKKGIDSFIAIHAGAGFSYKRWSSERFAEFIRKITRNSACFIILLGSSDERHIGKEIVSAAPDASIVNAIGDFSIPETYELLAHARVFLGNDSVLGHFAGSLGVPSLILMNGVVSEKRWRPLGVSVRVITGLDKEHHCLYDLCAYPCPHMQAISVDSVISAFEDF